MGPSFDNSALERPLRAGAPPPSTTTARPVTGRVDGLTIQEAAETTGWSPRMLRYVERSGLVEAPRTPAGYRIFGAEELQRLRTLRQLLQRFHCGLSDIAFAKRLRSDRPLREAVERWFEDRARRPEGVERGDWLRFEQEKHQRLLAA
jgi:MerR family transcriptional regulator, copper efflux regulator